MSYAEIIDSLSVENNTKILYLIVDGLGGLQVDEKGGSELEIANIPNLDRLASVSSCGLIDPVRSGITPGSGPSHMARFGYGPLQHNIGRGVFSAIGVGFKLTEQDVAARINFVTVDKEGVILDRRAGRLSTEICKRLCKKMMEK